MALETTSLILVAVMNQPRDLEIARVLGWYRIPLRSAPKVVAVDYLAFYQTAAFGEGKWRIDYIAPVRGHELTTRQELLRDEPDHPAAAQEYYKIQLGPLERLKDPIRAQKWRRITFFYTTGEYLLRAKTVDDLVIHSEERSMLWRTLRERSQLTTESGSSREAREELADLELSPETLALLLGFKGMD